MTRQRWRGRCSRRTTPPSASRRRRAADRRDAWCHCSRTTLVTGSDDSVVRIWDVASRQCLQSLPDSHQDMVWSVAFDPTSGGKRFATVGDDAAVRLY